MKNIHILPTDKPSSLSYCNKHLVYSPTNIFTTTNQNIYITSDEEINQQTKPCWCINTIKNTWNKDLIYYQGCMPQYHFIGFKKIILTTDQDLIKDGVQAIPEEFLEWFVKNPSCEKVELVKDVEDNHWRFPFLPYKIIIPKEDLSYTTKSDINISDEFVRTFMIPKEYFGKEEPKQETLENHYLSIPNSLVDIFRMKLDNHPDLHKQETLEEAFIRFMETNFSGQLTKGFVLGAMKFSAKWQQERMYSEEEVLEILKAYEDSTEWDIQKFFNQFKKK